MIVAMPVQSVSTDSELVPLFGKAKHFAIVTEKGDVSFLSMPHAAGGRDVARTLIAHDVDTLIASHVGFNPYVLLKSYGVKVYCEDENHVNIHQAVESLQHHELKEITPSEYDQVFGDEDHSLHAS